MRIINTIKLSAFRASDGAMHYETQCGDLVKLLWYDGQGMCLFSKRMDRGRFVWPSTKTGSVVMTAAQLSMLLEGRLAAT